MYTAKQKDAIARAPSTDKKRIAAGFRMQNAGKGNRNTQVRRRNQNPTRGAARRGRGRGFMSQGIRRTTNRMPAAMGHSVERRQSSTVTLTRSLYVGEFEVTNTDTTFEAKVYEINPTNLPWISEMAKLYGRYKFQTFQYRFVTTSPTTFFGSVFTAFQPISTNNIPANIQEVQQFGQHKIGPIHHTWAQFIKADHKLLVERWFRVSAVPQDSAGTVTPFEERVPARIIYGIDGVNAPKGATIGRLEVHATVTFSDPHTLSFTKDPNAVPDVISATIQTMDGGFKVVQMLRTVLTAAGQPARIVMNTRLTDGSLIVDTAKGAAFVLKKLTLKFAKSLKVSANVRGVLRTFFPEEARVELSAPNDPELKLTTISSGVSDVFFCDAITLETTEDTFDEPIIEETEEELEFPDPPSDEESLISFKEPSKEDLLNQIEELRQQLQRM